MTSDITALALEAVADIERRALAHLDAASTHPELLNSATAQVHALAERLAEVTARAELLEAELAERESDALRRERVLAHLAADSRDESVPLGIAVTRSGWTRRLVGADGAIVRCAITGCGGAPFVLAKAEVQPVAIAVDATHVFWGTKGGLVRRVAK